MTGEGESQHEPHWAYKLVWRYGPLAAICQAAMTALAATSAAVSVVTGSPSAKPWIIPVRDGLAGALVQLDRTRHLS
jgi:hypothetical protein